MTFPKGKSKQTKKQLISQRLYPLWQVQTSKHELKHKLFPRVPTKMNT